MTRRVAALALALTSMSAIGVFHVGAGDHRASPRLTRAQWEQRLQTLRPGMTLSQIQQTIRPKHVTVGRVFTSSGGSARLTLDDRHEVVVAIEPRRHRMLWVGP